LDSRSYLVQVSLHVPDVGPLEIKSDLQGTIGTVTNCLP